MLTWGGWGEEQVSEGGTRQWTWQWKVSGAQWTPRGGFESDSGHSSSESGQGPGQKSETKSPSLAVRFITGESVGRAHMDLPPFRGWGDEKEQPPREGKAGGRRPRCQVRGGLGQGCRAAAPGS